MTPSDAAIQSESVYPWYGTITGNTLSQGDILINFNIIVPNAAVEEGDSVSAEVQTIDAIIMTQTCDIEHGKVKSLLLCPCWDFWNFIERGERKGQIWSTVHRKAIKQGNMPGYFLANDANQDGIVLGLTIVDFHEIHTAPTILVSSFAATVGNRLRMLPPYREHLAQAFARFFMRVGLPVDIPDDKISSAARPKRK